MPWGLLRPMTKGKVPGKAMPHKIVFYGPPGSGKDTHALALAEKLGIPHFSAGQLLRDEVLANTEFSEIIKPHLEMGTLVPGHITAGLMRSRILSNEVQKSGYIINGYPRSIEALRDYLTYDTPTLIIELSAPEEVLRERLRDRKRSDDTDLAIQNRLNRYYASERPVFDYIREKTDIRFVTIDTSGPIEAADEACARAAGSGNN